MPAKRRLPPARQAPPKRARDAPAPETRARRSGSLQTAAKAAHHVPSEIFALVIWHLRHDSRALLRMSMVCRATRELVLRDSPHVWVESLRRWNVLYFQSHYVYEVGPAVVRNIPMRPYPNFKSIEGRLAHTDKPPITWNIRRSQWPNVRQTLEDTQPFTQPEVQALASHAIRTARVTYGARCGLCRCKTKLLQVWGLGMRVCHSCLKDNLISGVALFHEFGFNFNTRAQELAGKVYCFQYPCKHKQMSLYLTYNPVDFEVANAQSLVYFWRPHLERVVDLDSERRKFRDPERVGAAQKLSASVRAFFVRLQVAQTGKYSAWSSHRFFLNAPAWPKKKSLDSPHNVRHLAESERSLLEVTGGSLLCRAPTDLDARARGILQELFLGYRGPSTLPRVKNPAVVLERLRDKEALRGPSAFKQRPPSVHGTPAILKRWFDLAPAE